MFVLKSWGILTINLPVVYKTRYVMVLRRARSITRGIGRGGPASVAAGREKDCHICEDLELVAGPSHELRDERPRILGLHSQPWQLPQAWPQVSIKTVPSRPNLRWPQKNFFGPDFRWPFTKLLWVYTDKKKDFHHIRKFRWDQVQSHIWGRAS